MKKNSSHASELSTIPKLNIRSNQSKAQQMIKLLHASKQT